MIEYQLVRSDKRKSIALQVKQGAVTVRAPRYVSLEYIEQLLIQKHCWLESKLLLQQCKHESEQHNDDKVSICDGGIIWLNGQKKNIYLSFSSSPLIENTIEGFNISLAKRYQKSTKAQQEKIIKHKVECWLKEKAVQLLIDKVAYFSQALKLFPSEIKVRQYKARWGSCNSKGQISFNYLLLMTPDWVIDYVVVHELCHLEHLNHSKQFWLLVERHFPRFKEAKIWLKSHQRQLQWPRGC
ncbi:M48 family metallopeptidase [Colwelliaceae bacterium 6441]